MIILGIETSCDETAAAVLRQDKNGIHILSNIVASSAKLQAKYGGIIPEQAAREQIKSIIPVIEEALSQAFPDYQLQTTHYPPIDAIAVTYGPGLIGSLLVGVETAKTLANAWNKPLIPINHLSGHFYANWIKIESRVMNHESSKKMLGLSTLVTSGLPKFPSLGLLISGGHTNLVLFTDHNKYKYLGGTRDDAAGECFDKCARLLGLPYPGGPEISKLALQGQALQVDLPRPMINSKDYDFSFSGLKTAVANMVNTFPVIPSKARNLPTPEDPSLITQDDNMKANLAASLEQAIVDVLVAKTIKAAKEFKVKNIMLAGGVAANQKLKDDLRLKIKDLRIKTTLHVPSPELCTDNGAMIAAAGFFTKPAADPFKIQADPSLTL